MKAADQISMKFEMQDFLPRIPTAAENISCGDISPGGPNRFPF